jgi:hypothetical protein
VDVRDQAGCFDVTEVCEEIGQGRAEMELSPDELRGLKVMKSNLPAK